MFSFSVAKNVVKSYFFGKKMCEKKKIMKKKKMEKIFFYIIFLSKTTVNPLRKQNPYHGNSPYLFFFFAFFGQKHLSLPFWENLKIKQKKNAESGCSKVFSMT